MDDELDEFVFIEKKRAKRLRVTKNIEKKRSKLAKSRGQINSDQWHRYAKQHPMDCGNPQCTLCGNPRKILKKKTIQERVFYSKDYE